jgi:hypothetical protein
MDRCEHSAHLGFGVLAIWLEMPHESEKHGHAGASFGRNGQQAAPLGVEERANRAALLCRRALMGRCAGGGRSDVCGCVGARFVVWSVVPGGVARSVLEVASCEGVVLTRLAHPSSHESLEILVTCHVTPHGLRHPQHEPQPNVCMCGEGVARLENLLPFTPSA